MIDISYIKKNNHYLPQFYLRNWSYDKLTTNVYRKLVPNKNVPLWQNYSIRVVAKQEHLYTKIVNGIESDEVENWFEKRFETPVQESFHKAINERRLNAEDWKKLIDYVASQTVRTPSFYIKIMNLLYKNFPNILEETALKLNNIKEIVNKKSALEKENYTGYNFPVKTHIDNKNMGINIEADIGREMWLETIKFFLEQRIEYLHKHKWSIVKLYEDIEVMTSDNPVIFLNYYGKDKYDFGGGWASKGSDIIFPLSPKYIMYTQIGEYNKSRMTFDKEMSILVNKLTAENSYRYLFAKDIIKGMSTLCRRIVDQQQYKLEEKAWQNWHEQNL